MTRKLSLEICRSRSNDWGKRALLFCLFLLRQPIAARAQLTVQRCVLFLAAADRNRDNVLDKTEYPHFVTSIAHSSYTTFDSIPIAYQTLYPSSGTLDVTGARPGSSPPATAEQTQAFASLCENALATRAESMASATVSVAPGTTSMPEMTLLPGITASPGRPVASAAISVSFDACRVSMAVSDKNRDDSLSQAEYVTFLNRLTSNDRGYSTYDALPPVLQQAYTTLSAGASEIPIVGASPATFSKATETEKAVLQSICNETQVALSDGASTLAPGITVNPATATPETTGAPASTTSTSSALPFAQCRVSIAIADKNRDHLLDSIEYIGFLNRLTRNKFLNTAFEALPVELQDNFSAMAPAGTIDIMGAQPADFVTATDAQVEQLKKVCDNTQAITAGTFSLAPGSMFPSTIPPGTSSSGTLPPGTTPVPGFGTASIAPIPATNGVVMPPTYPPVPFVPCTEDVALSDETKDQKLDQTEYAVFASRLTKNELFTDRNFATLPAALQTNFQNLSTDGGFTISFQQMSTQQPGVASEAQLELAAHICQSTLAAINSYIVSSSTLPPTPPPKVATDLTVCKEHMSNADVDSSIALDPAEYVTFSNAMASGTPLGPGGTVATTFEALPVNLQASFRTMATGGDGASIPIAGTQPGNVATPEQNAVLQSICTVMDTELYTFLYGGTAAPVTLPTPPPTPRPTVQLDTCKDDLTASDTIRDGFLTQAEYLTFLNRLSVNQFVGVNFSELSPILINNFNQLAAIELSSQGSAEHREDAIDIFGARPAERLATTEEQQQHLTVVCYNTTFAMQDALRPPTLAPTLAPTVSAQPSTAGFATPAPTDFHGTVTVYSSFIIYNRVGILSDTLANPTNQDRLRLQTAYMGFVRRLVAESPQPEITAVSLAAETVSPNRRLNFLRRDRKLVEYQEASAELLDIEDRECPEQLKQTIVAHYCQTAYAWYALQEVVSGTQSQVEAYYSGLTQEAIQLGGLENVIQQENPNSSIRVYGATEELVKWSAPPTVAPNNNDGDEDRPVNSAVIFVVLVGLLALCGLGIYFAWNDKDRLKAKWKAFKKKKEPEEDLHEEDEQLILEGDDNIEYEIGEDGEIIIPEGFEDEEYEVEEEYFDDAGEGVTGTKKKGKRAKKLLNTLRVGKIGGKHRNGINDLEAADFLEEDIEDGVQDENLLDFEDYVFDTPAELLTEQNGGPTTKWLGDDGVRESTKGGAVTVTSFVAGTLHPITMTDSTASSASTLEGSDSTGEDFDDEYDSEDDGEEEQGDSVDYDDGDGDSYGLDFSDSDGVDNDADTISSKEEDFTNDAHKDDDSLSSTDEQRGATLLGGGDDIEGMLAAARLNNAENGSASLGSNEDSEGENDWSGSSGSSSYESDTTTSSDLQRIEEYRKEVKDLVQKVIPEELDNLSTMMDQFEGREAELINTLQNMEERTSTQRARAAVHKTKVKVNPNQVGGYSLASEGSAVIAAASTLGPEPQRRQPRQRYEDEYSSDGNYTEGSYSEDGSYYSEDGSYTEGSYYSGEEDEEYYDEEGTYHSDDEGTYDEEGTYGDDGTYDDDGFDEGTYADEDGSYDEEATYGDEGTYGEEEATYDDEGTYADEETYAVEDGTYNGDEGTYGDEEGTYNNGEGSYTDEDGDYGDEGGTYNDEDGVYEDEGTYNDDDGSYEDEEGTYLDEEAASGGEDSYVDEDMSFVDGERSYGDEGTYRDENETYYSDEGG